MTGSVIIGPWPQRVSRYHLAVARKFVRFWKANVADDMTLDQVIARLEHFGVNEDMVRECWPLLERALRQERQNELQRRA